MYPAKGLARKKMTVPFMVLLTEAPQIRHQAHFQASFPRGVDGEDKYAVWESNCLCYLLNSIQKMIKIFLFLNRS